MKPYLMVACDPSTKHLAFFAGFSDADHYRFQKYGIAEGTNPFNPLVCYHAERASRDFIDDLGAVPHGAYDRIVYIEAPVVGRGGIQTTMKQAMVSGAVQAAFVQSGYSVYLVPNGKWKKEVVGTGAAEKSDTAECVAGLWAGSTALGGDEDLTDAAAIYFYGEGVEQRRRLMAR